MQTHRSDSRKSLRLFRLLHSFPANFQPAFSLCLPVATVHPDGVPENFPAPTARQEAHPSGKCERARPEQRLLGHYSRSRTCATHYCQTVRAGLPFAGPAPGFRQQNGPDPASRIVHSQEFSTFSWHCASCYLVDFSTVICCFLPSSGQRHNRNSCMPVLNLLNQHFRG